MNNEIKYQMRVIEILTNQKNEITQLVVDLERLGNTGENLENKKINKDNLIKIIDESYE